MRSEEHTSELQSLRHLVCRLLLEKKKKRAPQHARTTGRKRRLQAERGAAGRQRRRGAARPYSVAQTSFLFVCVFVFFFFNDAAPPEIYPFPLHHPFPI